MRRAKVGQIFPAISLVLDGKIIHENSCVENCAYVYDVCGIHFEVFTRVISHTV